MWHGLMASLKVMTASPLKGQCAHCTLHSSGGTVPALQEVIGERQLPCDSVWAACPRAPAGTAPSALHHLHCSASANDVEGPCFLSVCLPPRSWVCSYDNSVSCIGEWWYPFLYSTLSLSLSHSLSSSLSITVSQDIMSFSIFAWKTRNIQR